MKNSNACRNLDLLRAVAVLCVLADHLVGSLLALQHRGVELARRMETIGHLGVLFFFVHTALVLMRSLDRSSDGNNLGLVVNFWIRRTCRIYPLCWAALLAIVAFKIPQFAGLPYTAWSWQIVAANVLLIQNLTHAPDMLVPLWSLPREAQMYAVLPFIFLLLRRFNSTVTVLILWFVSIELIPAVPFFAYFPCFFGGVLAYQLSRERMAQLHSAGFVSGLFILMAGYTIVSWSPASLFYDFDFLLCMALGVLIPNVKDIGESAVARMSRTIATHSYGIYLCHIPVIWFSFVCLARFPMAVQASAFAGLMIVLSALSFKLIEEPMMRVGQRLGVVAVAGTPVPKLALS